jgi:creatinine amidohydrolase/Fe(II)-dependent formamide hydrolase-like protein
MGEWDVPHAGHMESADHIYFQNMTMNEVKERLKKDDTIIIPVGSTEAHGAHACFGEDTFLVTRMAEAVARRTGCTVAQPIWYGSHPYHHLGMPGTVIVPEQIFCSLISCVIAGFWNAGFRKQILLNGHGQEWVIPTAIHQFNKKYQVPAILLNLNWYYAIPQYLKTKDQGGSFETPFIHADEAETSFSLALFPEMIHMEDAQDTSGAPFLPKGHMDLSGNVYQNPIPWYCAVGNVGLEVVVTPEGVVGKATLASADKAMPGVEALLDYIVKLHDDILESFPPGVLPPTEKMTMRPAEEIEALLKGPLNGGRHLYTVAYPPCEM